MLRAVAEADAEDVGLAADAVEHHLPPDLLEPRTERDTHEAELCVGVQHRALQADMPHTLAPLLHGVVLEARIARDREDHHRVAEECRGTFRRCICIDDGQRTALVEHDDRRREDRAVAACRRVSDPDRHERFDTAGDIHEDATLPERIPERGEFRLIDAYGRERALDEFRVHERGLLQGGDDDSLREQRVRSLDRLGHRRVDDECGGGRRPVALRAHRVDDGGVDTMDRRETLRVEC